MIERLDGKPLSHFGLRSAQWYNQPSGSWTQFLDSRPNRIAVLIQNVGTDFCYIRPAPLTDMGVLSGNAIRLQPMGSLQIDSDFPWLYGFESYETVAGATLDVVEIWDNDDGK